MATAELAILFSSVYVAGLLVLGSIDACHRVLGPVGPKAATVSAIFLVSLISMGLYQFHQRFYFRDAVLRVIVGLGIGCLAIAAVFHIFPSVSIAGDIASVAFAYALILILLVRYVFVRRVDENIFRRRTLFFGAGERSLSLLDLRRRADRRGFVAVGHVAAPGDTIVGDRSEICETNGKSIFDYAVETKADEIVISMDDRRGNLPVSELLEARLHGIERETGKIRIDLLSPGWLIFSPGFRTSRLRRSIQRVVDLSVSSILMIVTLPLALLIAIAIKIEDGLSAPILYRQVRLGKGEKEFEVLKFRSMVIDAEPDGQAVWAGEQDSRITVVGELLRKYRLDEIPQIYNVFKGEMSLVGPRPERPEFVKELRKQIPYYAERHTVKPGVTGWAQLKYAYGASQEDAAEKLQYDLYYIKNQSLMLDILIILQTVEVVLWGKGSR